MKSYRAQLPLFILVPVLNEIGPEEDPGVSTTELHVGIRIPEVMGTTKRRIQGSQAPKQPVSWAQCKKHKISTLDDGVGLTYQVYPS